jgi:hypothetical protein
MKISFRKSVTFFLADLKEGNLLTRKIVENYNVMERYFEMKFDFSNNMNNLM